MDFNASLKSFFLVTKLFKLFNMNFSLKLVALGKYKYY